MASKKIAPLLSSGRILAARFSSSSASALDLAGIFPPIPTPFNADESLAFDKLEQNFKVWQQMPFRGMTSFYKKKLFSAVRTCWARAAKRVDLVDAKYIFLFFPRQVTWCRARTVSSSCWKTMSASRWWRGRGSSLPRTNYFSPAPRVNVSSTSRIGPMAAPRFKFLYRDKIVFVCGDFNRGLQLDDLMC